MTCPPSELLVAAAAPDASQEVREQVADHLITCSRCAEEFRVLQPLASWAADHAHLVDGPAPVRRAPSSSRFGSMWAYATAAVLVLAVAGLEVQVQRLQRENRTLADRAASAAAAPAPPATAAASTLATAPRVAEQQRIAELEQRLRAADAPELNAPIIDLEPADRLRGAARPPAAVIPADARQVVFILNTSRPAAGSKYEVEIAGPGNRIVWNGSGLRQSPDGTLTLVVPRSLVGSASRLRLYARRGERRDLVEEYDLPPAK